VVLPGRQKEELSVSKRLVQVDLQQLRVIRQGKQIWFLIFSLVKSPQAKVALLNRLVQVHKG
jgi:hypothetical protein